MALWLRCSALTCGYGYAVFMRILSHKHNLLLRLLTFGLIAALMSSSLSLAVLAGATPSSESTETVSSSEESSEQSNEEADEEASEEPADNEDSAEIDALRAQATQARIQLDQMAIETAIASENYFEAQELLEATLEQIEETEEELEINQEQLDHVGDLLARRAVSSYQSGELSFVAFLFGSSDLADLVARINALISLMDNDADMIRESRQLRSQIENHMFRLEEKREVEREAAETAQTEFETVQRSLGQQQTLLDSLDSEVHRLMEEERAAIEAEQLRIAQEIQAEEERERRAQQETEQNNQSADAQNTPANSNSTGNGGSAGTSGSSGNASSGSAGSSSGSGAGAGNSGSGAAGSSGSGGSSNAGSGSSSTSSGSSSGSSSGGNTSSSSNSGSGGSSSAARPPASTPTPSPPPATTPAPAPSLGRERPGAVTAARRHIGVPYLWGGTTPAGFDCSGLVQHVFREAYGLNLPRTSRQQFHAGVFIPPNRGDLMRPGDLVFFSSTGRPENIHHVGIYIGNNRMIHAPQPGTNVREQVIWRHDFIGAVRP
ncbi:MAG: NlpC/P60 family protein [Coriobacteriia bacterium]|nr:NlpC/P60 family protein [Coriobacteriia bacterium]